MALGVKNSEAAVPPPNLLEIYLKFMAKVFLLGN
jgi:hypothetical protein